MPPFVPGLAVVGKAYGDVDRFARVAACVGTLLGEPPRVTKKRVVRRAKR